jgi:hypothetical protein
VERQDLFKDETNAENIGSSEDRCEKQRLARGKEADPRQCWVPAEVVCRPQASHTSRRPCSAKGKYSQGSGQEQRRKSTPEIKGVREKTTVALGVQENKPPRFKTTTTFADEEDIRQVLQEAHETGKEANIRVYEWATQSK